ncbi:MAG: F0F1 ATP synthase subunit delta [Firmicutes bacterium]|nr:F0F1 ATP synthase subunit delta [Bacillota bacterium]
MSLVERRYAASLIELADDKTSYEQFYQDLKLAADTIHRNEELEAFVHDDHIDSRKKKKVVSAIFQGKIRQELVNFLNLLIDKNRIGYLDSIIEQFRLLADQKKNILNITIASAFPVNDLQCQKLKEKYKKKYKASDVRIHLLEDKSLLGGIKVIIGDTVIDGTVKNRLEELKKSLLQ